ncbi:MAG: transposase [Prevotella sp.]|nr:transposase [Prevotella sp.]
MPRKARKTSETGIHHVMLRGINRQIIFEQESDYRKFVCLLQDLITPVDELGNLQPPRCTIYAFCLMPNHVHLLIKEKKEPLATIVKQVASRYAMYYNKRYEHFGHLFQDRYKSEPVNDARYFYTLLCYIHQNPIAGGLCRDVEAYEWSSWREYTGAPNRKSDFCAVSSVLSRMPLAELRDLINEPLPKTCRVLEFDNRGESVTDEEVEAFLKTTYGIKPSDLQNYAKDRRDQILKAAKDYGASLRQLARLTSIGIFIIRKA